MKIPAPISARLNAQQLDFCNAFFSKSPESLISSLMLKTYKKNHILISSDDSCSYVYILLKGRLQAIEEHVTNEPYRFTELSAIEIVGDFELFTKTSSRIVTLMTLESSLCLAIPASTYLDWIRHDANALFIRTQMLILQLVSQTKFDRQNFFLDNRMRLLHFLYNECSQQNSADFPIRISYTRPEISNKLGCSIRTINRLVMALSDEKIIDINHGKIQVNLKQYQFIESQIHTLNSLSL